MNHRYGEMLMQRVKRYNLTDKFRAKYEFVSREARKGECINVEPPHELLPIDEEHVPRAAVPTINTKFIYNEIKLTSGRTHDYLAEFYGSRNQEMARRMSSSIYPGAKYMDMDALIKQAATWKDKYNLPRKGSTKKQPQKYTELSAKPLFLLFSVSCFLLCGMVVDTMLCVMLLVVFSWQGVRSVLCRWQLFPMWLQIPSVFFLLVGTSNYLPAVGDSLLDGFSTRPFLLLYVLFCSITDLRHDS